MRQSIRSIILLPLCAFSLVVGTVTNVQGQTPTSPFAGKYAGTVTCSIAGGGRQTSTVNLVISASGKCSGTAANYTIGLSGTTYGTITHKGEYYATLVWNNGDVYTLRGTLRKDASGSLRGTVIQHGANGLFASAVVNLPPQ